MALHTLLLVSFRWKPRQFEKKIERWAHKVIFFVAVVLASVPLFFQGYNPETEDGRRNIRGTTLMWVDYTQYKVSGEVSGGKLQKKGT